MSDAKGKATLLAFHSHLEVLKAELFGLLTAASKAQREQRDDLGRRKQHFSKFQSAYDAAIELLSGDLRSVVPESAVEATAKAWCVNATKKLEKLRRWIHQIGFVRLNQRVYPPQWEATQRNIFGGVPIIEVPSDAEQQTQALQDELLALGADVFRFLDATAKQGGKASKTKESSGQPPKTLRPSAVKAFSQYKHAVEQEPTIKTDDEAYDWLVDDATADGIQLPRRDSWKRSLRRAREFHNQQKNGPRIGNETRSVVSAKRLDTAKRTKADHR